MDSCKWSVDPKESRTRGKGDKNRWDKRNTARWQIETPHTHTHIENKWLEHPNRKAEIA